MLSFIWWLIVGVIVGALARFIMPGKDAMSWIATLLLGVAGSILGGLVSWAIWGPGDERTGFQPAGFVLSLIGAILLLWVWRAVKSRSTV